MKISYKGYDNKWREIKGLGISLTVGFGFMAVILLLNGNTARPEFYLSIIGCLCGVVLWPIAHSLNRTVWLEENHDNFIEMRKVCKEGALALTAHKEHDEARVEARNQTIDALSEEDLIKLYTGIMNKINGGSEA